MNGRFRCVAEQSAAELAMTFSFVAGVRTLVTVRLTEAGEDAASEKTHVYKPDASMRLRFVGEKFVLNLS